MGLASGCSGVGRVKDGFQRARQRAGLEDILARLTGKPADLLCHPDLRDELGIERVGGEALEEVPLNAIVGSLGRCSDFTQGFLPRRGIDPQRWTTVGMDRRKWPPIRVYPVDRAYFVVDGHHRD